MLEKCPEHSLGVAKQLRLTKTELENMRRLYTGRILHPTALGELWHLCASSLNPSMPNIVDAFHFHSKTGKGPFYDYLDSMM
jgi:hypothetical protein